MYLVFDAHHSPFLSHKVGGWVIIKNEMNNGCVHAWNFLVVICGGIMCW